MRTFIITLLALGIAFSGGVAGAEVAKKVTFTKDVLPILQENCQTCHRPTGLNMSGMIAPMSMMTYQEVRPWAKAIMRSVVEQEMPPWHAADEFDGVFKNERVLSEDEIGTFVRWVEQGAKRGSPKDAPAPIEFDESGWNLGEPDLIVEFPEPYFVADEVEDLYHNVQVDLTKEQLPTDRWIKSVEFKPGSEVVHHIIGYADAGSMTDGEQATQGMLGGNAPGTDVGQYPDGYGIHLPEGTNITFAMHYHKESGPGTGVLDSSQMGFKFHEEGAVVGHPVEISTIAYGAFEIPPMHDDWKVGSSRLFKEDTVLISMMPHMHLRGKSAKYTAVYPDGTSEVLLDVPEYDFNWQAQYDLAINKLLPKGTRIEMELVFNNSQEQADAIGFNSARAVRFGGPTTDEMDLAWITVAPAHPVNEHGLADAKTGD